MILFSFRHIRLPRSLTFSSRSVKIQRKDSQLSARRNVLDLLFIILLVDAFFSCIAERARGMVGQLSRNAKAKKGETGITCRSLSTG